MAKQQGRKKLLIQYSGLVIKFTCIVYTRTLTGNLRLVKCYQLTAYAEYRIRCLSQKYICARTVGDEFSILLTGEQTESNILNIVNQLRSLFNEPVNVQGMMLEVTLSCDVVTYLRDGRNIAMLMDNAMIATYNAKANGKDRTCFFSPSAVDV